MTDKDLHPYTTSDKTVAQFHVFSHYQFRRKFFSSECTWSTSNF